MRLRAFLVTLVAAGLVQGLVLSGCGTQYPLPTESRNRAIPSDKSYQMLATWPGIAGVSDILLTQGTGSQLFILTNTGGSDSLPRGDVRAYPLTRPTPLESYRFKGLFNPVAMASGGDGVTVPSNNRIFVLDQGDTCLARMNLSSGQCGDTTGKFNFRVTRPEFFWRVKEFRLVGDTVSSFTDTSLAFVRGIAADAQGRVYVSGTAPIAVSVQAGSGSKERLYQYRVYRYVRGGGDPNTLGSSWHRDLSWEVEEGSGVGSMSDPRGMFWSPAGGGALYAADYGKNWVQKLNDGAPSTGYYFLDGGQTGTPFLSPEDVAVDLAGFVYIADTGSQRVLRYDSGATYIQRVDVEPDAAGRALRNPVAVAADDSLVYVADRDLGEVIRYKRRP